MSDGDLTDDDYAALAAAAFRARSTKRRTRTVPGRGEVWQVDFGITQKVRPALVISIPYDDADRALIGVIPHTTAVRGSRFEIAVSTSFLSQGVFSAQGNSAYSAEIFLASVGAN